MGARRAANLRHAGFELTVWNRTAERAHEWVAAHGGAVADRPADVAAASDVVVSMVVEGSQVERILLGDGGVADGARPGLLCVDMSTIGPAAARAIGARLAERGLAF